MPYSSGAGNTSGAADVSTVVKPRPLLAVLLLAAVAVLLSSCAGSRAGADRPAGSGQAGGPAAPVATVVRAYLPFDAAGKPAGTVSATRSGECWTTSVAATVASAYRCRAGNTILDPCFAVTPRARTVACAADPWSAVEVLHLTSPLPTGEPVGDGTRPWAVQLANGVRCVASTGTVPEVAGFLLDYSCRGGSGVSLADLDQPVVTAHWARAGATAVTTVRVVTLWHG